MKVRRAKLKDCKVVSELAKSPELRDNLGKNVPLKYFNEIVKKNKLFLVAEENKKVVGFILGEFLLGRVVYIHLLGVNKAFRGRGIGRKLFENLKDEAKKKKSIYLFFFTQKQYKGSIKFRNSLGISRGKEYISFGQDLS